ncbi:hypothetical protein BC628DRAFT_121347 [Trametes gibbosa]|nr:hypothetical protein BC628DRAFT_121347 [Trametes gibbosa]
MVKRRDNDKKVIQLFLEMHNMMSSLIQLQGVSPQRPRRARWSNYHRTPPGNSREDRSRYQGVRKRMLHILPQAIGREGSQTIELGRDIAGIRQALLRPKGRAHFGHLNTYRPRHRPR